MYKLCFAGLMLILLSGCYQEYVYVSDGYDMRHFNCSYNEMPYIQDYLINKEKYIDYNHYIKENFLNSDANVNASNTRRAQRNYINNNSTNSGYYIIKFEK